MWALRDFGTLIEYRRGTKTLLILVLLAAVASNAAQYAYYPMLGMAPRRFGGMSGVIYALFGYVWMKGRYEPEHGMMLHPRSVQYMLLWLVVCFTGFLGPVANVAHVVGLIVGVLYGLARF
jgi:GlpG protein